MKNRLILSLISVLALSVCCSSFAAEAKQRVLVLTDISNEPDDEESMVRFLVYANEYRGRRTGRHHLHLAAKQNARRL